MSKGFDFIRGFLLGLPSNKNFYVSTTNGVVATLSRSFSSNSTISTLTGSNSNLTVTNNQIIATNSIDVGASQIAIVRETDGLLAIEYLVNITNTDAQSNNFITYMGAPLTYMGVPLTYTPQ